MLKKSLALILALLMLILPLAGQAEQSFAFTLQGSIDPAMVSQANSGLAKALASGLNVMALEGEITFNEDWKFDLTADLMVKGRKGADAHVQSTSRWISLASSVLGDVRLALMMEVYLEFAMKPYNYLGMTTQYPALLTSRFAHYDAWNPVVEMCRPVLGGEGDRVIATEELVALAREISEYTQSSRALRYWMIALLMDLGSSETMLEMMTTLPQWIEEQAGDEGLKIHEEAGSQTWTLGGKPLYTFTDLGDGHYRWEVQMEREGYQVLASHSWEEGGNLTLAADVRYEQEPVFVMALAGSGLPDGQAQSEAALTLEMGGALLPGQMLLCLEGAWNTQSDGTVDAKVKWIAPDKGEPKATASLVLKPLPPREGLLDFTHQDLETDAVNVFTLNDVTLRELVKRVEKSVMKAALPLALVLPPDFVLGLGQWAVETGILDMLMPAE